MSRYTYTVSLNSAGEVGAILVNEDPTRGGVPWSDPDFQAWNAAQPVPFALSTEQQLIQTAKAMTFGQFKTRITNDYAGMVPAQAAPPDEVIRLWYILMQRSLRNEIV